MGKYHDQVDFIQGMQIWFNIWRMINIHSLNNRWEKYLQ
jgi:hypothetical protein